MTIKVVTPEMWYENQWGVLVTFAEMLLVDLQRREFTQAVKTWEVLGDQLEELAEFTGDTIEEILND